jgi:hypothetical protein
MFLFTRSYGGRPTRQLRPSVIPPRLYERRRNAKLPGMASMNRPPAARILAAALAAALAGGPALAADYSDPTWPCIQRKVEELSLGVMWPAEIDAEAELDPSLRAGAEELAATLALRRVELEDAGTGAVRAFAESLPEDQRAAVLAQVFLRVFDRMSSERRRIMSGIGRYALSQEDLSQRIEAARVEMTALLAAEDPDHDRIDALEAQTDWDERIFTDRARTLTYLCETPVILERRLYSVAQLLQNPPG